jgi:hypothetical protein
VQKTLTMMPGERYEIIIDFNDPVWKALLPRRTTFPRNLVLRNTAPTVMGNPTANLDGRLVQFRVSANVPADTSYNPATSVNQPTIVGFGTLNQNQRRPFYAGTVQTADGLSGAYGWTQGIDYFSNTGTTPCGASRASTIATPSTTIVELRSTQPKCTSAVVLEAFICDANPEFKLLLVGSKPFYCAFSSAEMRVIQRRRIKCDQFIQ